MHGDRRLGAIVAAIVESYDADPTQPLHFVPTEQVSYISHPRWTCQPDRVHGHDLELLEKLGLITMSSERPAFTFYPTALARHAVLDAPACLEDVAASVDDEAAAGRLRRAAEALRARGGTGHNELGVLISALMGQG